MNEGIRTAVTGYEGQEEEILRTLNATRATPRTRGFLDWRYLGERTEKAPRIFWLRAADGAAVAMAALIYRPYWVRGERRLFAVLGDISVHPAWRGKKLSTRLIQAVNEHLDTSGDTVGLVMANAAGDRSVASAGWEVATQLRPYACLLNPARHLATRGVPPKVARLTAWIYQRLLRLALCGAAQRGVSFRPATGFDAAFQDFWDNFPKQQFVLRDRGLDTLNWRCRQPGLRCAVGKFFHGEKFCGYIVHQSPDAGGLCLVLDFLVAEPGLMKPCLAAFLLHALQQEEIVSVRLVFAEGHHPLPQLGALGFSKRASTGLLRSYSPHGRGVAGNTSWFVTAGDKDA